MIRLSSLPLLAAPLWVACARPAAPVTPPPSSEAVPVHAVTVAPVEAAPLIRAAGTVAGKQELRLAFKIGGLLAEVRVDQGAAVKKGQLLAALDRSEIDAQVRQAEQGAQKARRDLERATQLHQKNVVTLQQRQDAATGLEVAEAALEIARFNQRHAAIVAPSDGHILQRFAEPGEMVAPGAPLFRFSGRGEGFVVRAGIAERDAVRVQLGDRALVSLPAHPGELLEAQVSELAPSAMPMTGTFEVELRLAPTELRLLSGLSAKVEIEPRMKHKVWLIPAEAVLEGEGDRASVFALSPQGDQARRIDVRLAFLSGDRVAIKSGLEDVQRIVTDGAHELEDGSKVTVAPEALGAREVVR